MSELLPFGEYRPDLSDLDAAITRAINNVYPRGDGYGPINSVSPLTAALAATCRGYFYAANTDGSVTIFAGTATRLYMLSNTTLTWTDVSKSGSAYTTLNSNANWQFAQFGTIVIAVQNNANVQSYNLASSSAFDDLAGSPPKAGNIAIVNRFVVLSNLTSNPYRVQWSGLNDTTNWSSGTNSSDYQDEPDGGIVKCVAGGEFGTILQESTIRRMTFSPGSDVIFEIQRIAKDLGILGAYSLTTAGERIFFLSPKGFYQIDGAGSLTPIGEEKVNRTFFEDYDPGNPQLIQAAADPNKNLIYWVYKSAANSTTMFDKGLVYNYVLQRWAPFAFTGEYIANLASPGLTMEGLDAIAPGSQTVTGAADNGSGKVRLTVGSTSGWTTGDYKTISGVVGTTEANGTFAITVVNSTHIDLLTVSFSNVYSSGGLVAGSLDALTFSLDSVSTAAVAALSCCNSDHKIGFFIGDALEATLETAEQTGKGQRLLVKGFYPSTDAGTVYGTISKRENLNATRTYRPESSMRSDNGYVPQLWSTRYARAKIRIPSGTAWTYANGVYPDAQADGEF